MDTGTGAPSQGATHTAANKRPRGASLSDAKRTQSAQCHGLCGGHIVPAAVLGVLGVIGMVLVGVVVDAHHVIAGDAHYVFSAARSLAYDGDLDLTNQYLVMGDRWGLGRDPTSDGWRLPPREIGASILMVPGLWLHHVFGLAPGWEPTCACLLAAASLGITWLGCARIVDTLELGGRRSEVIAGAIVLGFVVPFYAVGAAGYAHAPDAAVCTWLCWALLERRGSGKDAALIGVLLACAVLIRMQNVMWLLWPAVELAQSVGRGAPEDRAAKLRRLVIIAGIGALGFAPQLGLGLAHPGSTRGAIGWSLAFFDLDDLGSDLGRVLVGAHGLVRWTPVAGLALLGLGWAAFDPGSRRRIVAPLAVIVGLWLLFASVRDVDGGDAFGARRMAGGVGVLSLGLGQLWSRLVTRRQPALIFAALLAVLAAVNLVRTQQAIVGGLSLASPDPIRGHR